MPGKRDKILHYRRASWLSEDAETLEAYLKNAHAELPSVEERTVERGEGHFIRSLKPKLRQQGGIFIHLAADTPGEAASIVPKDLTGQEADIEETPPPDEGEFMDEDAFLFVRNDHLCYCTGGMRDTAIQYVLAQLFEMAELGDDATKFALEKIASAEKVQLLQARGVKEIILDASLYDASIKYGARHSQPIVALRSAARVLSSLVSEDDKDDRNDNLQVRIGINADGRGKNKIFGYRRITEIGEKVIENEESGDSYTIITQDGSRITESEIILKKFDKIDAFGKSVKRDKAWDCLLQYYKELEANHLLEL